MSRTAHHARHNGPRAIKTVKDALVRGMDLHAWGLGFCLNELRCSPGLICALLEIKASCNQENRLSYDP